ncbi:MAG TPA: hypothetical protein VGQ40_02610, partial [Chthoniobacterales bacterium]|nr:hypothetical protein [Chthoniobacterales bacterium]
MSKTGLLLLAVIAALFLPPRSSPAQDQDVDPSEIFLKAYMTAQLGEKLERENQFKPALSKFRFAGALIEELKKNHAEWQPAIVEYRGRKVSEAILRVQSKLGTQSDLAATAETPPEENGTAAAPNASPSGPRVETAPPPPLNPSDVQAAIQNATQDLRTRVNALENELKKSQDQVSAAQKEKFEVVSRLQSATAELERAKGDLNKSQKAEKEVRDQLVTAQNSLQTIQSGGQGNEQATAALRTEIAQLKKALETAEAGRAMAEKESTSTNAKLLESRQQVASLAQQRDTARLERDDALRALRETGDAQAR